MFGIGLLEVLILGVLAVFAMLGTVAIVVAVLNQKKRNPGGD